MWQTPSCDVDIVVVKVQFCPTGKQRSTRWPLADVSWCRPCCFNPVLFKLLLSSSIFGSLPWQGVQKCDLIISATLRRQPCSSQAEAEPKRRHAWFRLELSSESKNETRTCCAPSFRAARCCMELLDVETTSYAHLPAELLQVSVCIDAAGILVAFGDLRGFLLCIGSTRNVIGIMRLEGTASDPCALLSGPKRGSSLLLQVYLPPIAQPAPALPCVASNVGRVSSTWNAAFIFCCCRSWAAGCLQSS